MSPSAKTLCIQALSAHRGDNLYRAKSAFVGYLDHEMDEQYGESGMTRRQILAQYQAHDDAVTAAIKEVQELP